MKDKGSKFIKGALILALANFLVKIIGAFFKVPLYELIGKEGNGIFNVAYQIYTFMFIIATAGFPIAVSKMVAESIAKDDRYDARRVFETAIILLGLIGLVGSVVLYAFAGELAALLGNPDSEMGIRVIAPAVFFVSLVSAYRGYFQGKQNMYPTAASEVIESSTKLLLGLVAAFVFVSMTVNTALSTDFDFLSKEIASTHTKTIYSATGAIFGVTAGTFLALILMMVIYGCKEKKSKPIPGKPIRSRRNIMKNLVLIAIPITIGASVSSLTSLVDLATIMNRLVINPDVFDNYSHIFAAGTEFAASAMEEGWEGFVLLQKKANSLYGMYTGQAQTMFNLPLTIVVALSMSIVPAISTALAEKKSTEAHSITASVLRITMLFALPCAMGFFVLSEPILKVLYSDANASYLLQKLAGAVAFVALVSVSNAVLQAYGKVYIPVVNMLIGGVVKVFMNYILIPVWGIDAAPIATTVCYGIIATLNIIYIISMLKIKLSFNYMVFKPLMASVIMGAVVLIVYNALGKVMPESRVVTLGAIGVGVIAYLAGLIIVKGVKKEDVLNLPKGEKVAAIMTKYRLL
ncbi:MAG: polysaccharide biosynthesis protein [Clostridia bacterium]|nr:polysaccharide biosynthesis protein [Clostridia bacterium]